MFLVNRRGASHFPWIGKSWDAVAPNTVLLDAGAGKCAFNLSMLGRFPFVLAAVPKKPIDRPFPLIVVVCSRKSGFQGRICARSIA